MWLFAFVELFVYLIYRLFVSITQVIECEDRLRNDLNCVRRGAKLYFNSTADITNLTPPRF